MSTWQRIGVALFTTIGLMVGGLLYNRVFRAELLPLVDMDGPFSQPVGILETIVPIVILVILAAVWTWVIAGAVQEEKRVRTRRIR